MITAPETVAIVTIMSSGASTAMQPADVVTAISEDVATASIVICHIKR